MKSKLKDLLVLSTTLIAFTAFVCAPLVNAQPAYIAENSFIVKDIDEKHYLVKTSCDLELKPNSNVKIHSNHKSLKATSKFLVLVDGKRQRCIAKEITML